VDFAIRRPNPKGPGRKCQDQLNLTQKMLDERLAAFAKRGVTLPPPMLVADSWFSDSKLMRYVASAHQGTLLVQGKSHYTSYVRSKTAARSRAQIWSKLAIGPGNTASMLRAAAMGGFGLEVAHSGRFFSWWWTSPVTSRFT
jgi:hypothetical protein